MGILKAVGQLLTLPCRDITTLLSRAMDTELSWRERWAARIHLLYCRACRRCRDQLHFLHEAMHHAGHDADPCGIQAEVDLSPEARSRIKRLLELD